MQVSFSNLKLTHIDKEYHQGSLGISLKDGVLSVNPVQFNLFGGQILGALGVDAKQELPKVSADIQAKNVDLSLIKGLSEYLKNTPAAVKIKLQTQGDTKQALMSSLDGQIEGEILSGQFINKWMNSLPSLIGLAAKNSAFSYTGSSNQSKIDCMAVNLKIKDGIIHSDENIALETSALNLVVSGDINLVQQDVSLSVLPSLNQLSSKTNKNISYLQYFRVQGPFSQIKIQEDVKGAIEDLVQEKAQKAVQKLTGESVVVSQEQQIGDLCQIAQGKKAKVESKKQEVQAQIKEAVETKVKDLIQDKISETALKLLNKQ